MKIYTQDKEVKRIALAAFPGYSGQKLDWRLYAQRQQWLASVGVLCPMLPATKSNWLNHGEEFIHETTNQSPVIGPLSGIAAQERGGEMGKV